MRILVDTNRIIAALVKQGTTRSILFNEYFEFVTPDYTISEIMRYKEEIKRKARINDAELEILLALIFERITVIPESEYASFIGQCKDEISDPDDIPQLACCLASKAEGIWAHDPHFKKQNKINVFTNIDMLRISEPVR